MSSVPQKLFRNKEGYVLPEKHLRFHPGADEYIHIDKFDELKELVIWMTGCGYDFCQHEYFCEQRDKLLKDKQ
jgi:hypothetical protein